MTGFPAEQLAKTAAGSVQDTLQRGALGILGVMCLTAMAGVLYAVIYLGPKVVESIQAIAPTITAEMARQSEGHAAERKAWADERRAYMDLLTRMGSNGGIRQP